jgi:hypothetical protein
MTVKQSTKCVGEPVVLPCIIVDVDYSTDVAAVLIQDTRDYEFNNGQYWLTTEKPQQRKPLTDEQRSVSEQLGEPVAWYVSNNGEPISEPTFDRNEAEQILAGQIEDCGSILSKLYTTQQRTWVGLTAGDLKFNYQNNEWLEGVRWAEAKLKEKNNGAW